MFQSSLSTLPLYLINKIFLLQARHQEYKDPIEEEWEKFVKVIREADNESNAIIAEDQEEATTERQIDEIDEQMKKLSRYGIRNIQDAV